jgi:hypothetical protein
MLIPVPKNHEPGCFCEVCCAARKSQRPQKSLRNDFFTHPVTTKSKLVLKKAQCDTCKRIVSLRPNGVLYAHGYALDPNGAPSNYCAGNALPGEVQERLSPSEYQHQQLEGLRKWLRAPVAQEATKS